MTCFPGESEVPWESSNNPFGRVSEEDHAFFSKTGFKGHIIFVSLHGKKDQVFKFTKKNVKFGLVIENYEAVNSTDEEFEDSLKQGEIRIAWYPEGKEEILPESNVSEKLYLLMAMSTCAKEKVHNLII